MNTSTRFLVASVSSAIAVVAGAQSSIFVVGTDAGVLSAAKVYSGYTGDLMVTLSPFDGFSGGVRVAVGDVNGDGTLDVITGVGAGAVGGHIKVYDGTNFSLLASMFTFDGFAGGVQVGAGDINNDGFDDVIVGAGAGAPGGHVKVFSGNGFGLMASFFSYPGFSGGVTVAGGDLEGDGASEILSGAGAGAPGGHVKAFDGSSFDFEASFFAYPGFTGGVNVGAGDLDGDGRDEILTGAASVSSHVKAFTSTGLEMYSFLAYPGATVGVRVGTVDRNNDGRDDIIVGPSALSPHVKIFDGVTLGLLDSFFAFDPGIGTGVFVAGGTIPRPVPEPATVAALGLAVLALARSRRSR